ncbi:ATP-dependent DNA helicase chl1 [Monascus purpureus]|nr:ATP-dependent DNA helicase chl1 [Monascus purpureus]
MLEFAKRESHRAISERKELEARLARARLEEEKRRASFNERPKKKQRFSSPPPDLDALDDGRFALEDYESESDEPKTYINRPDPYNGLSASTLALLERFKGQISGQASELQDPEDDDVKIFYCSRTHSQLTQFAAELRRVTVPSSIPEDLSTHGNDDILQLGERVKHVSLGSRKNLCINPKVAALGNATSINERCLDLQQPSVSARMRCPYLPSKDSEALNLQFRDHALASIKDIEDLGKVGKQLGLCPYYASRSVVKHSEIITLPYPLLLQKSAREALDLSIKGHVVIIDEAHNLMDAISNIHSVTVTLSQLRMAHSQLTAYARRFKTRLKGKNRSYIAQVIRLIDSIATRLRSILESKGASEGSIQASDLMAGKGVDQINPYKLSQYLQESKLARKVDGYSDYSQAQTTGQPSETPTTPVLFHIQSFLLPLMNPSAEGHLFYLKSQGDVQLKYMLLDPTNHFRDIVEDARAVILAGGTMSPMTDYVNHLFSYVGPDRLKTFSYGHVIPPENLTAQSLGKGVLGSEFSFTYNARDSEKMILDLGQTIATLCQVIPDGVVAFFPSYDYLSSVLSIWKRPVDGGARQSTFSLIEQRKPIFYESRGAVSKTEEILQEYTAAVESGSGALLLSVIGGKLSEGINFSDELGRGVLIIGLPFPNIHSVVWQSKIRYVEEKALKQGSGSEEHKRTMAKASGRDFYENACMRAVNQSIGRAIRHRNDYAAIIMIDKRYDTPRIQGKLPTWIRQSFVSSPTHRPAGVILSSLSKFFARQAS